MYSQVMMWVVIVPIIFQVMFFYRGLGRMIVASFKRARSANRGGDIRRNLR